MSQELPERVEAERPTVLIVDDERDNLEMLRSILEDAGMEVLSAPSGEAALEVVSRREIDLVLLDLSLPVTAGLDHPTTPLQRGEVLARVGKHLKLARLTRELARQNRELSEIRRKLAEQIEQPRAVEAKLETAGETLSLLPETLNLNAVKSQLIAQALAQTQGNVTAAARILGVHRSWFYRRRPAAEVR